jgi:hypothetical protein
MIRTITLIHASMRSAKSLAWSLLLVIIILVGSVPKEPDARFAVVFRKLKDIRSTHQDRGQQRFDVLLML